VLFLTLVIVALRLLLAVIEALSVLVVVACSPMLMSVKKSLIK
jgi:hypothetical protein